MKEFDKAYKLLDRMYRDGYFPDFLVDKVKFDAMTLAINDLEEEFEAHDSELETEARESIGETVDYILQWFHIDIGVETAIRERDW